MEGCLAVGRLSYLETVHCYETGQYRTQRVRVWVGDTRQREAPFAWWQNPCRDLRPGPRMLSHTLLLLFNCGKIDMVTIVATPDNASGLKSNLVAAEP